MIRLTNSPYSQTSGRHGRDYRDWTRSVPPYRVCHHAWYATVCLCLHVCAIPFNPQARLTDIGLAASRPDFSLSLPISDKATTVPLPTARTAPSSWALGPTRISSNFCGTIPSMLLSSTTTCPPTTRVGPAGWTLDSTPFPTWSWS